MKKSWLAGVMSAALIVSLLAGCSSNSSGAAETKDTSASSETTAETTGDTANTAGDSDTILIGVSASITGSAPTNGLRTQQGAQLAVDEINAAGGVLGKQLELYVADDGGLADTGINATNLIASQGLWLRSDQTYPVWHWLLKGLFLKPDIRCLSARPVRSLSQR